MRSCRGDVMIRLNSVETEQYQLEVGECDCGYHFGVDATFLLNVNDFKFNCPCCNKQIDTTTIFLEGD